RRCPWEREVGQQQKEGKCKRGVHEVVYTHSNQRVVGGSKAEERISRAAVRDVFERKMYSQLPANHLLGTQEVQTALTLVCPPDSQPCPSTVRLEQLSVDHPVTYTNKSVHHTRRATFIIGETPQAICRQQLEEMAETFKFPSVHQFAVEIVRGNSSQRLAWLRQYYTSLNHPDLANTVTNNFPQPDSAQTSSLNTTSLTSTITAAKSHTHTKTPQKHVPKAKRKPKDTHKNTEPKTKDIPSSPDLSHGRSTTLSKPTAQGREQKQKLPSRTSATFQGQRENRQTSSPPEQAASTSSHCSLLTDLIGDTSILDDLLKPKPRGVVSKGSRKDFWDILNEGNEESINRLTDPAEVQRVCINTNFAARGRSGEEDSKSLWKTNEKFLWKK
uniref:Uncharacterized protein n=1 Tax=Sander lucioperca TaxID=283035 RepID=A0A8C9X0Z4_SANLU